MADSLLSVRGLRTIFHTQLGEYAAVDGVDFDLHESEILGIVGESGSGKSVMALSLMRLVPPPGVITAGEICFQGRDMRALTEADMRRIRGRSIAMIFQDPMSALNPYLRVGEQIAEVARLHLGFSRRQANIRAVEMLERVGIPEAIRCAEYYPHQLSGGMRQRVMIAAALTCKPRLLIADEPTTALDVTIQHQILALLHALVREERASMILITHDFGVIAGTGDKMLVMYGGRVMESGSVARILAAPRHPYTRALLRSIPDPAHKGKRLFKLPDAAPQSMLNRRGCPFAMRCPEAVSQCRDVTPPGRTTQTGHIADCWIES